ncbi:hypothetical protein G6F57_022281 [Rhizopus arrhizus]|nr:hypothetical protein G6F57_022281 [Rhizopus arrhizus]
MDAVREIAALMTPGITTGEAIALADQQLQRMGASHNWHPTYIRFGPDSQSPAVQPTDRSRTLGENDIFVVDIGPAPTPTSSAAPKRPATSSSARAWRGWTA